MAGGASPSSGGWPAGASPPPSESHASAPPEHLGILIRGEVSEWLMVPLSKSGVRKHRGFESHPLRHTRTSWTGQPFVAPSAPSLTHIEVRSVGCSAAPRSDLAPEARDPSLLADSLSRSQPRGLRASDTSSRRSRRAGQTTPPRGSRRGRLVDYGAALEMRFAATRRGFESRPLRHSSPPFN
jgi:hypothetical protein